MPDFEFIQIRVNKDQHAAFVAAAKETGLSLACWMRSVALKEARRKGYSLVEEPATNDPVYDVFGQRLTLSDLALLVGIEKEILLDRLKKVNFDTTQLGIWIRGKQASVAKRTCGVCHEPGHNSRTHVKIKAT